MQTQWSSFNTRSPIGQDTSIPDTQKHSPGTVSASLGTSSSFFLDAPQIRQSWLDHHLLLWLSAFYPPRQNCVPHKPAPAATVRHLQHLCYWHIVPMDNVLEIKIDCQSSQESRPHSPSAIVVGLGHLSLTGSQDVSICLLRTVQNVLSSMCTLSRSVAAKNPWSASTSSERCA